MVASFGCFFFRTKFGSVPCDTNVDAGRWFCVWGMQKIMGQRTHKD